MLDLRSQLQTALGDAYVLERELGGGGMSRVFVATERSLGRQVVVKVLPSEMAGQVSAQRFRREIAVAAQLQHPHIVPLLTAGDAGGLPYFTMPFVKGESLRARIAEHGELPLSEAVRILREIASALAFAHDFGVVHRDIKPDNVLLSAGAAMVTDFGVAKALSASTIGGDSPITSLGVALGTPMYMSPEQASADPLIDHRADIYAWGVLAYEILTGNTPFSGRPAAAMLSAHVSEAPEHVSRRRPAIPPALATLVMQCLEKRAADRPQHANELLHALDALSAPRGGVQPTAAMPALARRVFAGDWRWLIVAGATTIVIISALVYWRRQTAPAESGVRAIAVLPFENVSGDPAFDYLAEGMSDELRSELTRLPGLNVKARSSSNVFRGRGIKLAEVGAKLGVSEVLEGSVRQTGTRLHVTVELVRIADGNALWSHTFDGHATTLTTVLDSITRAIAGALRVRLAAAPSDSAGARITRGTSDYEAYNLFLKGEYHRRKFEFGKAISPLRESVARDPRFARAHASLASAYAFLPMDGFSSPDSALTLAAKSTDRALALDATLVQAYMAKGTMLFTSLRWRDAEHAYRRAVELDREHAEANAWLGYALAQLGRLDEALVAMRRARELDPLAIDALIGVQYVLYLTHGFRDAINETKPVLDLDPNSTNAWMVMALSYAFEGRLDSAVAAMETSLKIDPTSFGLRMMAMFVFAAAERWQDAAKQRALAENESGNAPNYIKTYTNLVFGDLDAAVAAAERGMHAREPLFAWTFPSCDPTLDPLKSKPRFIALMKEFGATVCPPAGRWPITPQRRVTITKLLPGERK